MSTPSASDPRQPDFWRRRTGLIMPLLLLVTGIVLAVGTVTMEVPDNVASPGPQLFPTLIAVGCFVFAVLLAVDVWRRPEPARVATRAAATENPAPAAPAAADGTDAADDPAATAAPEPLRVRSNRPAVLGLVGTVVAFIVLLLPLGWILAGAGLFWGVARTLGSRRTVFDIFLAIAISSGIQLAFSAGLGLNLPPGVLEGVF
ncbi:tripartite tricarboxylate transporter TctB family protein [Streptomyces sp. XM4011]|uniref:tripartite tricarboxylate transporter TctB family protein n=1 Tax=Streptomyces sp. XM4011 TaxID=2929780 RepID=UPI001FF87FA6|nr:tripartite tricarboxylate transporter TctB family protein [Streptomyces sp. XM4011]MCK1816115.1 tripartite tricarboxylate transporter TctB family protein [Streptomyces sp. XM4011]